MPTMQKLILFVIILISFFSCSKSSEEIKQVANGDEEVVIEDENMPEEENEVTLFTMKIDVKSSYFNENFSWHLSLSDSTGTVIKETQLENTSINVLEAEIDANANYDLTLLERRLFETSGVVTIRTYSNIKSGNYLLEENDNGVGGDIIFTFINTGFPLEVLGFHSGVTIADPSNGGSFELETTLSGLPFDFYRTLLSPDDSRPRYYYNSLIETIEDLEIDYRDLPLIENTINIEFPSDSDFIDVSIHGFSNFEGLRVSKLIDDSKNSRDIFFYPNNIFDNYEIRGRLVYGATFPQIIYEIAQYGKPENDSFSLPDLESEILNSDLDNFIMQSQSEYDFYTTTYTFLDRNTNVFYRYLIFGEGKDEVMFSHKNLLSNILNETGDVSSEQLRFINTSLIRNSHLNKDYNSFIQSTIDIGRRQEFPSGTLVESLILSK